jgi:hypothetical protein
MAAQEIEALINEYPNFPIGNESSPIDTFSNTSNGANLSARCQRLDLSDLAQPTDWDYLAVQAHFDLPSLSRQS